MARQAAFMRLVAVFVALLVHELVADKPTDLVTKSINKFAKEFNKISSLSPEYGNNLVTCPFCVHLSLCMLHLGAGGNTSDQLATVLGLSGVTRQDIGNSYRSLLSETTYSGKNDSFEATTHLVPERNFTFDQDYVSKAQQFYLSNVGEVVYNTTKRNQVVTQHEILSAAYTHIYTRFNWAIRWKKPFTSAEGQFDVSSNKINKTVQVKMLTRTDIFKFKEDLNLGAKVLKININDEGSSILFVLPEKTEAVDDVEARLGNLPLNSLLDNLKEVEVTVTIPSFIASHGMPLRKILSQMGLEDLFTPQANLQKISSKKDLLVDTFMYAMAVSVDRFGVMLSSSADASLRSKPFFYIPPTKSGFTTVNPAKVKTQQTTTTPVFSANRPFLYYIIGGNGEFLVYGKIKKP